MATALLPPVKYDVAVPDVNALFAPLQEGLELRRKAQAEREQNVLSKMIGSQMAGGDVRGAATTAYQGGDIATGVRLSEMADTEKTQSLEMIGKYAALANTPEKWARMALQLAPRFGGQQFLDEYGTMQGRDALIAETLTLKDALSVQETAAKREEKAGKAPDTVTIYGPSGQAQTAAWNSETKRFEPIGGEKAPTGGVQVITHPDGTTETIVGGSGGLGKRAEGEVELRAINAAEMAGRVASTMEGFKPEFLTYGTRFQNAWRGFKSKVDPESLSQADQQALGDFATWRATAFDNLSVTLKEMSGAAVTPQEYERLRKSLPDPGTAWYNGDDPVTFKAKMDNVMRQSQAALARYQYYLTAGIPSSPDKIPLGNVKQLQGKWYVKDGDKWYEVGGAAQSN